MRTYDGPCTHSERIPRVIILQTNNPTVVFMVDYWIIFVIFIYSTVATIEICHPWVDSRLANGWTAGQPCTAAIKCCFSQTIFLLSTKPIDFGEFTIRYTIKISEYTSINL